VKEVHATVSEAKELAGKVTETLRAGTDFSSQTNDLVASFLEFVKEIEKSSGTPKAPVPPEERGRPFDIAEWTAAAGEFTKLARELTAALREGHSLLDSPMWMKRQQEVNRLAQEAVGQAGQRGKEWADHVIVRVLGVIVAFFILLLLYRAVSHRVVPRPGKDA